MASVKYFSVVLSPAGNYSVLVKKAQKTNLSNSYVIAGELVQGPSSLDQAPCRPNVYRLITVPSLTLR